MSFQWIFRLENNSINNNEASWNEDGNTSPYSYSSHKTRRYLFLENKENNVISEKCFIKLHYITFTF